METLRRFDGKLDFQANRSSNISYLRCTYIRHAEAGPNPSDHARPLTSAGAESAVGLGVKLQSLFGTPDLIFSSDAKRAHHTAELLDLGQVSIGPGLYLGSAGSLSLFTQGLPQAEHVVIVAHNPGLTELLWRHAPNCSILTPASGFQLIWEADDWLLTGVEAPIGWRQLSGSGESNS